MSHILSTMLSFALTTPQWNVFACVNLSFFLTEHLALFFMSQTLQSSASEIYLVNKVMWMRLKQCKLWANMANMEWRRINSYCKHQSRKHNNAIFKSLQLNWRHGWYVWTQVIRWALWSVLLEWCHHVTWLHWDMVMNTASTWIIYGHVTN